MSFCNRMNRNEFGKGEIGLNDLVKNELTPKDFHNARSGIGYAAMSTLQQHNNSLGFEKERELLNHTRTLNKTM